MTAPLVVAVDPGSKRAGVVVRWGSELCAWGVAERKGDPLHEWTRRILSGMRCYSDEALSHIWPERGFDGDLVWAVEDFHVPTPHLGRVHARQVVETAWVVAYIYATAREEQRYDPQPSSADTAVLVPPNDFGRAPLGAYPPELVTDGERRGQWQLRPAGRSTKVSHARSAWDLAGAAPAQLRTRYAAEGA